MDIAFRARTPLIITAVAVVVLAVVTSISNPSGEGDGGDGQQVAAGRPAPMSGADVRASATPSGSADTTAVTAVTTTTLGPGSPGELGPAGGGAEEPADGSAAGPGSSTGQAVTAAPATASTPGSTTRPTTQVTIGTTITTPPATAPPTPALSRLPAVEQQVLDLTNADRAAHGAPAVSRNGCMDAEASAWARHMATTTVMAHSAGGGDSVQGCRGADAYWGDNIGHWQPCYASDMEAWWMNSPSHRPHVLDPAFDVVGIGVWAEPNGRCWFQVFFGS